jgi:hypothetical protein
MNSIVRCKVRVSSVTKSMTNKGEVEYETVKLCAVYDSNPDSENGKWSKWTPSANFEIQISNPSAMDKLSKGHEFYVDFTPVV